MAYIYEVFEHFSGCGWAYGFTLTLLLPQTFPQNCESWLKYHLVQVCKPCPYALIEAVEPFKLHPISMPYIYERFEHLLRLLMGIWLHIHILPPQTLPQIWESWRKSYLMQVCKPCHYSLIEAVELFKLHPIFMAYIYERFEHLLRLRMGIWLHIHILPPQMFPQICESWLKSDLMQVCKPCHYALVEAVEPFKLHPMSMAYIYERFEHLFRLWMVI